MLVMPACATGWFWHCLARETGRIGHLLSPDQQRGPWPWIPYALDNGAFACWDPVANTFDHARWAKNEVAWRRLIVWTQVAAGRGMPARWAIVPDVPGNREGTLERWKTYAPEVASMDIPLAIAVQDGMTPQDVETLVPRAQVVCVGGSTDWKWATAEMWVKAFPRVHILRCNSPTKLTWLEQLGVESTDGTGWNRGDRKQTQGLEEWARLKASSSVHPLWPHASRAVNPKQLCFA